jgi:DNA-binding response OmpR family regulator
VSRVLVVDDEADIRGLLRDLLERAGHSVTEAADGRDGVRLFYAEQPDLVILDVAMPGFDGWQVLERIRELSSVPVLMLTARTQELDKVRGLRAGADDYITKPFGRQELLARVDAHLRRRPSEPERATSYADANVEIDFTQRSVRVRGDEVSLTPLEFKLLTTFVQNPSQVLSHEQLLQHVWRDARGTREQVKLYVGYLRRKLGELPDGGSPIETVRGFGYRYNA